MAVAGAGAAARNTPTFEPTAIPTAAATTTMAAAIPTTISSNGRYVSKRYDTILLCVVCG